MAGWHQTIWGIIILGAIGSILSTIILKTIKILIDGNRQLLIDKLLSNSLLVPYAENKLFSKMCVENNVREYIVLKYMMTMSKYSRNQIVSIITLSLSIITWVAYCSSTDIHILAPILFTLTAARDLYNFARWYLAISGCFPEELREYQKNIDDLKQKGRRTLIESSLLKDP